MKYRVCKIDSFATILMSVLLYIRKKYYVIFVYIFQIFCLSPKMKKPNQITILFHFKKIVSKDGIAEGPSPHKIKIIYKKTFTYLRKPWNV